MTSRQTCGCDCYGGDEHSDYCSSLKPDKFAARAEKIEGLMDWIYARQPQRNELKETLEAFRDAVDKEAYELLCSDGNDGDDFSQARDLLEAALAEFEKGV